MPRTHVINPGRVQITGGVMTYTPGSPTDLLDAEQTALLVAAHAVAAAAADEVEVQIGRVKVAAHDLSTQRRILEEKQDAASEAWAKVHDLLGLPRRDVEVSEVLRTAR